MAYIEDSLSSGEKISSLFEQHWVVRIPMVLWLLLVITLPVAIYEYLRVRHTEQGVTNKRVIFKTGIISRKSEEMKIGSIETVEIDQGILGRILGYGNVRITGSGSSTLLLRTLNDPMAVKRAIESISHPAA